MKIETSIRSYSVQIKVRLELKSTTGISISVGRWCTAANSKWEQPATVNWPAIGEVPPEDAMEFAAGIYAAAAIARKLNQLENPATIDMSQFVCTLKCNLAPSAQEHINRIVSTL